MGFYDDPFMNETVYKNGKYTSIINTKLFLFVYCILVLMNSRFLYADRGLCAWFLSITIYNMCKQNPCTEDLL